MGPAVFAVELLREAVLARLPAVSSAQTPWRTAWRSPCDRCRPLPIDDVVDVRPGDRVAETAGASWLLEYGVSRDLVLRERIILAYLGLADRLAAAIGTAAEPPPRISTRPPGRG
jgi:hypothetical protein